MLISLRELIASGFCGKKIETAPQSIGHLHRIVDEVIFERATHLGELGDENTQIAYANQYTIKYEDHVVFRNFLSGVAEKKEAFSLDIQMERKVVDIGGGVDVRFIKFFDKLNGAYVEPAYQFYLPSYYIPFYGIMAAYLCGSTGLGVRVRVISAMGDFDHVESYPVIETQIKELLASVTEKKVLAGQQCQACPITGCTFNVEFQNLVMGWLKIEQKRDEIMDRVKEFLIMNGPTKVGTHLVYLKDNPRRTLKKGCDDELFGILSQKLSATEIDAYYKPDAAAILKLVDQGKLPEAVKDLFKTTYHRSIETGLSL